MLKRSSYGQMRPLLTHSNGNFSPSQHRLLCWIAFGIDKDCCFVTRQSHLVVVQPCNGWLHWLASREQLLQHASVYLVTCIKPTDVSTYFSLLKVSLPKRRTENTIMIRQQTINRLRLRTLGHFFPINNFHLSLHKFLKSATVIVRVSAHTADKKRHTTPANSSQLWQSTYCYFSVSLTFPFFDLPGSIANLLLQCNHCF